MQKNYIIVQFMSNYPPKSERKASFPDELGATLYLKMQGFQETKDCWVFCDEKAYIIKDPKFSEVKVRYEKEPPKVTVVASEDNKESSDISYAGKACSITKKGGLRGLEINSTKNLVKICEESAVYLKELKELFSFKALQIELNVSKYSLQKWIKEGYVTGDISKVVAVYEKHNLKNPSFKKFKENIEEIQRKRKYINSQADFLYKNYKKEVAKMLKIQPRSIHQYIKKGYPLWAVEEVYDFLIKKENEKNVK